MKKLFVLMIAAASLAACKNDKKAGNTDVNQTDNTTYTNSSTNQQMAAGWNQATRDKYRQQCEQSTAQQFTADKSRAYCDCLVAKAEARFPMADSAANMTMAQMQDLAKDCLPK